MEVRRLTTDEWLSQTQEQVEERIQARADWIRRKAKGVGLYGYLHVGAAPESDESLAMFGVKSREGLFSALRLAFRLFPESLDSIQAIHNALNIGPAIGPYMLKERREEFAAKHGISTRTVMRLEEQGARAISEWVDEFLFFEAPVLYSEMVLAFAVDFSSNIEGDYDEDKLMQALTLLREAFHGDKELA